MAEDWPATAGRPADMQAVYKAHVRALYAFIHSRVGNREAAEDLTSDVFLKALTHLDLERQECSVVAWLFRVARSAIADYWRAGYSATVIPFDEACAARGISQGLDVSAHTHEQAAATHEQAAATHEQAAAQARAVLAQLPETYRAVLVCRLLEGRSVAETAERLGISGANVKVVQHRALKRAAALREEVSDDG